ncbi:hypothetical protein AB0K02_22360 [Streptomyces sp. NPDC049597]|uniref:hypothetical protein n=1 Tax=Streptomyces sp. NPDC049597 TaxID=3155276 RepID=UPI00341ED5A5
MTACEIAWTLHPQCLVPRSEHIQSLVERAAEVLTECNEAEDDLLLEDVVVGNVDCGTIGHAVIEADQGLVGNKV